MSAVLSSLVSDRLVGYCSVAWWDGVWRTLGMLRGQPLIHLFEIAGLAGRPMK